MTQKQTPQSQEESKNTKKNSIYDIFHQYSESDPNEKEFQDTINHQLDTFKEDETKREKIREKKEKSQEKELIAEAEKKKIPAWLEFVINILVLIILLVVLRSYIFVPFTIKGHSMEGSLHDGEFIYVDKASPYFSPYERGDIIVFIPPHENIGKDEGMMCLYYKAKNIVLFEGKENPCLHQVSYIKRIIGLPGDVIEIKGGHVYLTPPGGKKQEINQSFLLDNNKNKTCLGFNVQECNDKKSTNGKIYPPVPQGKYFVLGDNRTNSSDSRQESWESHFIDEEKIIGIARLVFLSPPPVEERDPGFMGMVKTMFGSFSGDRVLHQEKIIDEE